LAGETKILSLSKARKLRERSRKRAQADENAAKFGRTKSLKASERARADKARRDLDGHERE
jgi:hypothetical protein